MNNEIIVFISEGEKTEKLILENLNNIFFKNDKNYVFLSFKADIYQLYEKMKMDDFSNIIELLIERDPNIENILTSEGRDKLSISQVFLFFDYDGQASCDKDLDYKITEMIDFFQNETEEGRIYVSYPMVEALKDIKTNDNCFRRCSVKAKVNIRYKQLVTDCTEFTNIRLLNENDWYKMLNHTLKKVNCIVSSKYEIPNYQTYKNTINQIKIFENQIKKFINPKQEIAVLSSFPLFLFEFFRDKENFYRNLNSL